MYVLCKAAVRNAKYSNVFAIQHSTRFNRPSMQSRAIWLQQPSSPSDDRIALSQHSRSVSRSSCGKSTISAPCLTWRYCRPISRISCSSIAMPHHRAHSVHTHMPDCFALRSLMTLSTVCDRCPLNSEASPRRNCSVEMSYRISEQFWVVNTPAKISFLSFLFRMFCSQFLW